MNVSSIGRYNNRFDRNNKVEQKQIKKRSNKNNQAFKGAGVDTAFNLLDQGFKLLDKNAMIQVAFVDSVATDIPRTIVDLKTGLAAALETMRREFSGLIVNCLLPGFIVKGIASLLPKANELKGTNVINSWANSDIIGKLTKVYNEAQQSGAADKTRDYVEKALTSIEGLNGTNWIKYADKASEPQFQEAVGMVTEAISKAPKDRKVLLQGARTKLASLTKAESILKFDGKSQSNLEETLRDIADMGSNFNKVKNNAVKNVAENADEAVKNSAIANSIGKYSKSLNKIVNQKSILGLGVVIALAVSIQKINRAITRKQFKSEGAPIYKDFGKKDTTQKMDEKQKKAFGFKKVAAALGMYGLAALSMMKKPSLGMFQFSNIFPTLDQCRWIASSTFASRMLAAEDENELRETVVRDMASFAGLYFLGDYVKKGVASGIEALSKTKQGAKLVGENVVLLNRKNVVAKPVLEQGSSILKKTGSSIMFRAKQFGNWIKNTELKTALEVSSTKVRNMRNICRVADIAFSIIMLGILLPKYNRSVTEKKVAAAKKLELEKQKNTLDFMTIQQKQGIPAVFKSLVQS